jgi:integrase
MSGDGSLFQRKKGQTYYLIISRGYDPGLNNGKGGYKKEWIDLETTDETEAKKRKKAIMAKEELGKFHNPKITVDDLFNRWLEHCKNKGLKRRTIEEYKKIIDSHITKPLGKFKLTELKAKHIRELIESKQSQFVARKIYIVFNSAFKLGMSDDDLDIGENPCTRILAPKVKRVKHPVWSADEAKKFLKQTFGAREYGIFLCSLTTGMRIGEVLGLRWQDVDFKNKTITINQTLEEKIKGDPRPQFGTPKTEASQAPVLMTDLLVTELKKIETRQKEEKMKSRKTYKNYGLVFANFKGEPVHLENLRNKYFNGAIEKAEITKIRIHDMRHSAATLLLSMGISLDTIQRYLRHAQRETTEIYAHNDSIELIREATEKMNRILK